MVYKRLNGLMVMPPNTFAPLAHSSWDLQSHSSICLHQCAIMEPAPWQCASLYLTLIFFKYCVEHFVELLLFGCTLH